MTIRPLDLADIPLLTGWIVAKPLWQRYRLDAARLRARLETALERGDILLVADADPGVRACGFAWCLPQRAFARSAYLRLIGVREGYTGSGIGAQLLDRVEDAAAKTGKDLFLLVSDFNEAAQRFYRRQGYRQVGALPAYILPDVTELVYWKRLYDDNGR